MLHQTPNGLPEPGDFRPGSWLDVGGLVIALVGVGPGGRNDADDVAASMASMMAQ